MNVFHHPYKCHAHKLGIWLPLVAFLLNTAGLLRLLILQWFSRVQGQLKWKISAHLAQAYQEYIPEYSQNVN